MLSTYFIQKFLKDKIKPKSTISLGTSSTSLKMLKDLAIHNVINDLDLKIIPSSTDIAQVSREFKLTLAPIQHKIDMFIDFADYADSFFNYIKTSTQSLIRDKMIARYAKECYTFVRKEDFNEEIVPIPLEVSKFGTHLIEKELYAYGDAKIRVTKLGQRVKTLESNYIIDLKPNTKYFDFDDLEFKLKSIPGILETGLFSSYADKLYTVEKTKIKEELNKKRG